MFERFVTKHADDVAEKISYFDCRVVCEKFYGWINYMPVDYPQMALEALQMGIVSGQDEIKLPSQYPTYFAASWIFGNPLANLYVKTADVGIQMEYGIHQLAHVDSLDVKKQFRLAIRRACSASRIIHRRRLVNVKLCMQIIVGDVVYDENGAKRFSVVHNIDETIQARCFLIENAIECAQFDSRNPRLFVEQIIIAVKRMGSAAMLKKIYQKQ